MITLKNDHYRKARGGYARLLAISCRKCGKFVMSYQKDGPGNLRRLYFDRMFPTSCAPKKKTALRCTACKEVLGTYGMYQKEKREAFRLYWDAVTKKIKRLK